MFGGQERGSSSLCAVGVCWWLWCLSGFAFGEEVEGASEGDGVRERESVCVGMMFHSSQDVWLWLRVERPGKRIKTPSSHVSCLMSHVSCLMSHVSCLMSHVSCPLSHVSCPLILVERERDALDQRRCLSLDIETCWPKAPQPASQPASLWPQHRQRGPHPRVAPHTLRNCSPAPLQRLPLRAVLRAPEERDTVRCLSRDTHDHDERT